jgi:hypothetical protein
MSDAKPTTNWENYEQVAQHLLNEMAVEFGLGRVEDKQIVPGECGTSWEIDAKGFLAGGDGFVIIECRRYRNSRISQEKMAALAYRIRDTGAAGGILVSPLPPQSGAVLVAEHENIKQVQLSPESTRSNYILTFLNQVFVGVSMSGKASISGFGDVVRRDETRERIELG